MFQFSKIFSVRMYIAKLWFCCAIIPTLLPSAIGSTNEKMCRRFKSAVHAYIRIGETGTSVRMYGCFHLIVMFSLALFQTGCPESIYGGNADHLQNCADLQLWRSHSIQDCKNAMCWTMPDWNFRGGETTGKNVFVYPCSASEPLFCAKGLPPWEIFRTKKSAENSAFKGHSFRPALAFGTGITH